MIEPQNKRMQLTKLRAAPVLQAEVPPWGPPREEDRGTASQLIRSVRRTGGGVRILATAASLLTVAAGTAAASQTLTPPSLTAGAWTITWTADAGRATHTDGRVVSLWEQPKFEPGCDVLASGKLLSVVGTIVSFESSVGGYCQGSAHGFADRTFQVVDLDRTSDSRRRDVTLYDFFDKAQVQRALDADPFLREARKDKSWSCSFTLEEFERSFAFHHTKADKVAVRIGLTHGCEVARGYLTQLGLLLKPRPDFLAQLRQAEKAGTLMNRLSGR